jgi:hypothetical protein
MAQNMSGIALNPQNVVPLDINTSTTFTTTVVPPYQNVSSGSYLLQSQPLSDVFLQTTDRGAVNSLYFSFSTASQVLIGTPSSFLFQNKNDFNYFPLVTRYSPFQSGGTVYAVAWNGIIWVAGGGGGTGIIYTLASSVDGISWTPRDPSLIITQFTYALAWNGFLWVAVGSSNNTSAGNVVCTSPDGIVWTGRSSFLTAAFTGQTQARVGAASFLQANNTVSPQSNNVTLIGQNANQNFYFSTVDALNLVRYPFANGTYFWYAAWNGSLWMATGGTSGAAATVYISSDGINWTTRATVTNMTLTYGVAWSPQLGIWVVCGATATAQANVQYSFDTFTWTLAGPAANTTTMYDVQWSPVGPAGVSATAAFIAVGASASVFYATSATTFTAGVGPTGMTTLFSIAYAPTLALWMVVGTGGTFTAATAPAVNGSWTGVVNSLATMTTPAQIAWSQTLGIFVVAGTGVNALMSSVNGTSFVGAFGGAGLTFQTFTTAATGVAFNYTTNLFVATGTGINSFLSSADGLNWVPFGTTGVDSIGRGVAWSPLLNQFLMVGTGSHTIATSVNGINWVGRTGGTIFSTQGNGVAWATGLNTYVAVGSGTNLLATSTNGINWIVRTSQLTSAGNCVAWNGSIFVAGGSSGGSFLISTSPDSVNWTGRTQSLITTNVLSLAYSPLLAIWVAGGTGTNSLIYSINNGVSWLVTGTAGSSATLMTLAYAVAWNPQLNNFLAGGNTSNTMLTSVDGVNWLGMNALNALMTTVYCIAWNGSLWLAGGTGTNTLATSVDGILWVGQGAAVITTAVYAVAWSGVINVNGLQPAFPQSNNGLANNIYTWIAVGTGTNVVAYSLTGTAAWTAVSQSVITGIGYAVIWYPYTGVWVVAGQGTNQLMYTAVPTGQSGWTAVSGTQITTSGRALAYGYIAGAGQLIAVGVGASANYATSANGITWTGYLTTTFTSGYGVAWGPSTYNFVVAGVGTNTLAYTFNPANGFIACNNALTTSTATIASIFGGAGTGQANAITWNGNQFIAVGQGPVAQTAITYGTNVGTVAGTTPLALSGTQVPYAVEATSIDGINWRPSPFAPSQFQYLAVGSRNPLTVCGGTAGTGGTSFMGYSIDNGNQWLVRGSASTSFTTGCYAIAFNGLLWVAGGQGGQTLLQSKDGVVWVTTGISGTFPQTAVYGIVWANSLGLWVCVGYGTNTIATSVDGLIWVGRAGTIYTGSANAVGWNGTFIVVIGNNGTSNTSIVYSRDGISYSFAASNTTVPMPASQTAATAAMTWNGNVWVLVTNNGATNTIYFSANAFSWNSIVISALGTTAGANGSRAVGWSGTTFLVAGLYPNYATSPDGFTWTARTLPAYANSGFSQINTVIWNPVAASPAQTPAPFIQTGGQWVMGVTDTGVLGVQTLTSPDGINWTFRMNNAFTNLYPIRAMAWSSQLGLWAIVGVTTTNYTAIGSSVDGLQITPRVFFSAANQFYAVAWNGSQFLAGGLGMYYSSDGINWVNQGLPAIGAASAAITVIFGITFAPTAGQWTVVGQAGGSFGGIAVGTAVTNILGIAAGSTFFSGNFAARGACTNNASATLVVGLTGGTANACFSSTSLQAGYASAAIPGFTTGGYGCVFVPWLSGGTYVAVGAGTAQIVTATTPGTWTNQVTSGIFTTGFAVTANAGIIVAVGTGTFPIAYSYNGSTWIGVTASSSAAIFTNGYTVVWNGFMFVAGGDNFVQATSPDGVNWSVRKVFGVGAGAACYALAYQQREKTLTINNSQWTGRTSQQNFRILG